MTVFENIKNLAKSRHITMKDLALELGFSENLFYTWKKTNPKASDLAKVADYFHVTVDYLLGRDESEPKQTKVDLAEVADDDEPNWDDWLSAGGKPLTESDKIALKLMFYGRGKSGKK
ncbi:helix-turn-helix domain-containing protein [Lactococcus garvieae]|nr:helix-turn-helix domain-containing protein [Lactococcus garvieae]CEF51374.1 Lactococcus bacteriophage repressor [Lactococcus garvieae]